MPRRNRGTPRLRNAGDLRISQATCDPAPVQIVAGNRHSLQLWRLVA
jgi:hypothetical protein